MFKFWYEKFIASFIPILVFVSVFGIVLYAFYTEISVPPADQAPFVQEIRKEAKNKDNTADLISPHLTDSELKNWITMAISEALAFNKNTYGETIKKTRNYFTDAGFQKYQDYLITSGIAENIHTHDYDMSIYIQTPPLQLNAMVMNDTYKWLYQMPVVISFFPTGQKSLAKDGDKFINRSITLRLQITRAKLENNPDAIQIEDWIVGG